MRCRPPSPAATGGCGEFSLGEGVLVRTNEREDVVLTRLTAMKKKNSFRLEKGNMPSLKTSFKAFINANSKKP